MRVYGAVDGGEKGLVEIKPHGESRYTISVNGHDRAVAVRTLPGGGLALLIDARSYDVTVERETTGESGEDGIYCVHLCGRVVRVVIQDDVAGVRRRRRVSEGPETITAPMPGRVVTLLVNEGDKVLEGQGVIVIEAMKMENELTTPRSGSVTKIQVASGEAVDSGTALMIIE